MTAQPPRGGGRPASSRRSRLGAGVREDVAHRAILDWLRAVLPAGYLVHHSPNGDVRDERAGARLKRLGAMAGWPDLMIVQPGGAVFLLEVKRPDGGTFSAAQRLVRVHCIEHGIPWSSATSIDEAREALSGWGIHTREVAT